MVIGPGWEVGLVLLHQAQYIPVEHGNFGSFGDDVLVVNQARGVGQQVAQGDFAAVGGELRKEVGQAFVERVLMGQKNAGVADNRLCVSTPKLLPPARISLDPLLAKWGVLSFLC